MTSNPPRWWPRRRWPPAGGRSWRARATPLSSVACWPRGAILGGEISGHYFFGELGGDDALYATLMLLRVLDDRPGLPLRPGDRHGAQPIPSRPTCACHAPPSGRRRILDELQAAFADYPIRHLDGVRVQFPEGWALARISVTEPLITLRFEARTAEQLAAIQRQVRQRAPQLDALLEPSSRPLDPRNRTG